MRATFTVEVPDEFVERRAREVGDRYGPVDAPVESASEYFAGRCQDIADDELPLAFYGWPISVTVAVGPSE